MVMTLDSSTVTDGRSRILHRAAELFLTKGYAETSLRTIADEVGIRPASIYHHFESKDALLTEILDIGMDAVFDAFDAAGATASDSDPRARLLAHVNGHLQALFAHHAFTAAHVTVFPFVPDEVRKNAVGRRDEYEARWTALLESVAPSLDASRLRVARLALFGAMNSTVQWFDPKEGSLDELASTIVDALWFGLDSIAGASA